MYAIFEPIGPAPAVGPNCGASGGHPFERSDAEAFPTGRVDVTIGGTQECRNIVSPTGEYDAIAELVGLHKLNKAFAEGLHFGLLSVGRNVALQSRRASAPRGPPR